MSEPVVDELFVDLIGDDIYPVLHCDGRDLLQGLPVVRQAGGIGGAVQYDRFCLFGDRLFELGCRDAETLLLRCLHDDGGGIVQDHLVGIGDPVGGGDDHLVAGIEERFGDVVEAVFRPAGNEDLRPFIGEPVVLLELVNDRVLELVGAAGRSVLREARLDRLDPRQLDVLRRVKIRFADAEIHYIDALRFHGLGLCRHGKCG